jgi:hypothetical protein
MLDLKTSDDLTLAIPRCQGGLRALELLVNEIEQITDEADKELKKDES